MAKRLWCGLVVASLGIGVASAQQFLDDQVLPVRAGVTVSIFEDGLGCGGNGLAWSSFLCEPFAYHSNIGPLPAETGSGFDAAGAF